MPLIIYGMQIVDDDDDAGGAGLAELGRQRASAIAARQQAEAAHEGLCRVTLQRLPFLIGFRLVFLICSC